MLVDIVNGFLGSGKTTFIQSIVKQLVPLEKVVVLVNEFGEIGIDGIVLAENELDVVEMTSGCICCTLAADLGRQLLNIAARLKPDRVIIEPTGVASIKGLLSVVGSLRLEKYVEAVKVITLLDASDLQSYDQGYPAFLESQAAGADLVLINKTDLVSPSTVRGIRSWTAAVNPGAKVLETAFGEVRLEHMDAPPVPSDLTGGGDQKLHHQHHEDHCVEKGTPDYQSFSGEYRGVFDIARLKAFFRSLNNLTRGEVIRAKGIFYCAGGFKRIDYVPAGGVTVKAMGGNFESSRVLIIGRGFTALELENGMRGCLESSKSSMGE